MHELPKLDRKRLREFGLLTGAILVVLFGLLLPWIKSHTLPKWPWIIAIILWFWAWLAPMTLKPVYQIWMRIGLVLGWVNSRIILGIVFFGLLMPMGVIMRLFNRDLMGRKFESQISTYRSKSQVTTRERMEKPF